MGKNVFPGGPLKVQGNFEQEFFAERNFILKVCGSIGPSLPHFSNLEFTGIFEDFRKQMYQYLPIYQRE